MWWQERRPQGRLKAIVFLLHPGPSLLVTATFVAVAGLALRSVPPPLVALRLAGVMLSIQFAIGIVNDVADLRSDAQTKPYKPLVRGAVPVRVAAACGAALALVGVAVATTFGAVPALFAVAGLAAGLLYDAGLHRTPLSFVPWCGGFLALPLCAFAAAGRLVPSLWSLVPLAVLLAVGLHCANALPDIGADRTAGRASMPVLVGERGTRVVMTVSLLLAAVVSITLLAPARTWWTVGAAALVAVVTALAATLRWERPFPLLALVIVALAVAWLGAIAG